MKKTLKKLFGPLLVLFAVLAVPPAATLALAEDPDTADRPFLSIAVNGTELDEENIVFRGPIDLGSWESAWAYVHEDVPYYHVTVPCGTESVDVTYSAETEILDGGTHAYGYATELTIDAVSSATIKRRTFSNAYTRNDDGTQTVKTPVTGYLVNEDDKFMAITLEEDGGHFEAICLFSFLYDGKNHVYTPDDTADGATTYTCICGSSYTVKRDLGDHAPGDVNGDGGISGVDAVLVLKYAANILQADFNLAAADVNGDGRVNGVDAVLILKHAAGIITKFPIE